VNSKDIAENNPPAQACGDAHLDAMQAHLPNAVVSRVGGILHIDFNPIDIGGDYRYVDGRPAHEWGR